MDVDVFQDHNTLIRIQMCLVSDMLDLYLCFSWQSQDT